MTNSAAAPAPAKDHIYCDLDRFSRSGEKRAVLRVSTSQLPNQPLKVHVREWTYSASDPSLLVPLRGIALNVSELEAVIYSLALVREDLKREVQP